MAAFGQPDLVPPRTLSPRTFRIIMAILAADGLLAAGVALIVYLGQGSQIRVTAPVLSERCHQQRDLATFQLETRCDASVRFETRAGQVVTTTITDAFPSEFSGRGRYKTIVLRYDSSDPTHPYKQSNFMTPAAFVVILAVGCAVMILASWGYKRADRLTQKAAARRAAAAADEHRGTHALAHSALHTRRSLSAARKRADAD